jgi:hypothetical protein
VLRRLAPGWLWATAIFRRATALSSTAPQMAGGPAHHQNEAFLVANVLNLKRLEYSRLNRTVVEPSPAREFEELPNGYLQTTRDLLQLLERWGIDAAFDQTEEINRDSNQFGELLLCQPPFSTEALQVGAELSP